MTKPVNPWAVTGLWEKEFDEAGLRSWAEHLRAGLAAPRVTMGLVFISPRLTSKADQILELLRVHAQAGLLAGCSGKGLVLNDRELEDDPGLVVGLYHLPGAKLEATHLTQSQVEESNGPGYWHLETGVGGESTHGWLAFVDPFTVDTESWLAGWNEAYPGVPTVGGMASTGANDSRTQVYLNGEVYEDGGVVLSVGGRVRLASVVSQGCTPIGETWTITKAEGNLIHQIGNRPAYEVLAETVGALPTEQQQRARGNLFLGLVMNEYKEEFERGDFLVRNLLGGDPSSGILAVGARPRTGQSVQFQCREARTASEDLNLLLGRKRQAIGKSTVYGGCLFCCTGRGERMFGVPHHDATLVQRHFGPIGLTGFFCNGEVGPVADRNYLHGYTASVALFVEK